MKLLRALLMLMMLGVINTLYASFNAYVDDTKVNEGEMIYLTLEYIGRTDKNPDIEPLKKDFHIMSQSVSTRTNIINGKMSSKKIFNLEIMPKSNKRKHIIPSLSLGKHRSKPIEITIKAGSSVKEKEKLSLTAQVDKNTVYVKEQVILTIRLKTSIKIESGSLSTLELNDAVVEKLNEDDQKEIFENGKKYLLITQKYALFPLKPVDISVPPVVFDGIAKINKRPNSWSGFYSRGRRIVKRSNALNLKVKDIPSSYPKNEPFLPLNSFAVVESFDEAHPQFKVGKAVSRKFELRADGALTSFIPSILTPSIDGINIYQEEGEMKDIKGSSSIMAVKNYLHAYIPERPGEFVVPKQEIYWWDVKEDTIKTTTIRPLNINVADNVVTHQKVEKEEKNEIEKTAKIDDSQEEKQNYWMLLAIILLLLWVLTIAFFLFFRKNNKEKSIQLKQGDSDDIDNFKSAIINACSNNMAKDAYIHLIKFNNWLSRNAADTSIDQEKISKLIKELEECFYGHKDAKEVNDVLFEINSHLKSAKLNKDNDKIPPLHPM